MNAIRSTTAVATLLVLLAAPPITASALDVTVEFAEEVDFSRYATYAWKEGTAARRPSGQEAIVRAVDSQLEAKGLRRVESDPDLHIATHALVDRQTLDDLADAAYWEFMTGVTSVDLYDLGAGTLVVDMIDARSEKIVWRGLASGAVSGSVGKMTRKVDKAVGKLFEKFPPQ